MAKRIGKCTINFDDFKPKIRGYASVCGNFEKEGPLGETFDITFDDSFLGEDSWEEAESKLQTLSSETALKKAGLNSTEIDFVFAGDLLNQCISSTFGVKKFEIPFLGQYGACSTMAQNLILSAIMVNSKLARNCLAVTSSHFCSAERQFRMPLEYGGQRPTCAQWTVTGSGALIVGQNERKILDENCYTPYISSALVGKIVDFGVVDVNNMGAAMAPAAANTIKTFLEDTCTTPKDYDLILTGDLGTVGSRLLKELLAKEGIDVLDKHNDCGLLIYDRIKQDVHSGGSGCGCSASVLCSLILQKMEKGTLKNIIFVATGALMSTTSSQQGKSIPGIAHLVNIKLMNI